MSLVTVAIGLSILGGLGGLLLASFLLLLKDSIQQNIVPKLISYAVGTLLGVALLALLPEALNQLGSSPVLGTLLTGILGFFTLEKLVIWRHCHTDDCDTHDSSATLILVGGAVHNFTDGCIIGAAVFSSIPLGISTALAVAAHQVPQEVGDFAILLGSGYSRRRALLMNGLSASTGILGAIGMFWTAGWMPQALPYILAFSAGSFLYVAMADLIPGLHRETVDFSAAQQVVLIAAGIATVMML